MAGVRWSRGAFRIWLVATIVWGLTVAAMMVEDLSSAGATVSLFRGTCPEGTVGRRAPSQDMV
jgi:hypothetical protein